jgi:hypothetical protein
LGGAEKWRFGDAAAFMDQLSLSHRFTEFLTFPAYELLD